MNKSELVKVILIIIMSLIVLLGAKGTIAANNTSNYTDLTNTVSANNTTQNNTTQNTSTSNRVSNNTTNNTVLTTNNTAKYNDTSLPKTGIDSPVPTFILLVVFGISALYAYKKIQDYRNI